MSSTNRGAVRRTDDAYETPAWCVHRLLETGVLDAWRGTFWIEPACGSGAIVRAVPWVRWAVQDIRHDAVDETVRLPQVVAAGTRDFLERSCHRGQGPLVTNPPYSLAEEFVRRAFEVTTGPVAMLLRLGWLSSAKRAPLLRTYAPDVYVLPDRPSFTGHGTDSADYCWCVWPSADSRARACGHLQVLALTSRAERAQAAALQERGT